MLGCSACISGRQTSTRTGLDWDAPVTGGGKGMGGRDRGGVGAVGAVGGDQH